MSRDGPEEGDLPDEYKVDEILNERTVNRTREYFVSFKGWGRQDQQWVAANQFDEDDGVVLAFRAKRAEAARRREEEAAKQKADKEKQKVAAKAAKAAGKWDQAEARKKKLGSKTTDEDRRGQVLSHLKEGEGEKQKQSRAGLRKR